jgi:hypothetical protein
VMTEYAAVNLASGEMGQDERLGHLKYAFNNLGELNSQGTDSRYNAGARVWAQALGSSAVRGLALEILEARSQNRQEPFLNIVELWMRASNEAAQHYRDEIGWPQSFDAEDPWRDLVGEITDRRGELIGDFVVRMVSGEVQSNVPGRAIFPAILAEIYKDRFGSDTLFADVGACMLHTPKALKIPINTLGGIQTVRGGTRASEERQLQRILKNIEVARPTFGPSIGYERENMLDANGKLWDPRMRLWVEISTIRPDEGIEQPEMVREYREIDNYESDDITLVNADFTEETESLESRLGAAEHDLVNVSAMLYQHQAEPEMVSRILRNCRLISNSWGIIGILDFARPNRSNPQKLEFFHERRAYSFRGMVYDILQPELGFREVVRFQTGRCKKARVGRDWASVVGHTRQLAS